MTKLRELRLAKGLGQKELAYMAKTSSATIHYLETDPNHCPTLTVANKVAKVFRMKAHDVFPRVQERLGRPSGRATVCPPKIPCSWCGVRVCPLQCERVEVKGYVLLLGHDKCREEQKNTEAFA
jgi:DNA-binding XRE family transcriptional regulator